VSVNGTPVESKLCTFTLESTHFIFNYCPIYPHDGASAKFSTNSQETDYSVDLVRYRVSTKHTSRLPPDTKRFFSLSHLMIVTWYRVFPPKKTRRLPYQLRRFFHHSSRNKLSNSRSSLNVRLITKSKICSAVLAQDMKSYINRNRQINYR
jgi:hypothetical protein